MSKPTPRAAPVRGVCCADGTVIGGFIDFASPIPGNELYAALHPHLMCPDWDGPRRAESRIAIRALRAAHGDEAYAAALMRGQYTHADGAAYGGMRRSWSRRILEELAQHYLDRSRQVCIVDFHTGFGRYGAGTPIVVQGGDAAGRMAAWWVSRSSAPEDRPACCRTKSAATSISGLERLLPATVVTGVNMVFGTYDLDRMLDLLVKDCWVHNFGDS